MNPSLRLEVIPMSDGKALCNPYTPDGDKKSRLGYSFQCTNTQKAINRRWKIVAANIEADIAAYCRITEMAKLGKQLNEAAEKFALERAPEQPAAAAA